MVDKEHTNAPPPASSDSSKPAAGCTDPPLWIRVLLWRDFGVKMVELVWREAEPPSQLAGRQLRQQLAFRQTLFHQRAGPGNYRVQLVLVCFQPGPRHTWPFAGHHHVEIQLQDAGQNSAPVRQASAGRII